MDFNFQLLRPGWGVGDDFNNIKNNSNIHFLTVLHQK